MDNLLENINSPDDLKDLPVDQLKELAEQIRQFLLDSISKTGGHLASNLGVVELTLALHYVFDFKDDKLLWDVGHQCYIHKILTGRKVGFENIRKADGLSGFPNPQESIYDQFAVGHAGTSIATAIGMALGQKMQDKDDKIVALVGDASIVNGTSFEALNNLGLVKRQLLIVLNDNSMAIDATQGAVAKYFSKVRLSHTYEDLRKRSKTILEHLPLIGKTLEETLEKIKKSIRMVMPGSQLFESLNIPYFGPVDGHDVEALVELFSVLKQLKHPAILHVYTQKGSGFSPAEQDRSRFHSTGPFRMNGDTLHVPSKGPTFTEVFGEHLTKLAETDQKIVAITSAMTSGTGLDEFKNKFPDRFYDVGIAESAAIDIAAGIAKSGLKPVVCIYSTFLQRGFDHIFQEISLQNLPVVFCIDRAGAVGADGPTHQGMMDIGFLRMMPNMMLIAPANDSEMRLALEFALQQDNPVCLRYPKDYISCDQFDLPQTHKPFEAGKSVIIKKNPGSKIAIVAYGSILSEAVKAAQILDDDGIKVDLINARFAAPVDKDIINLLDAGSALITVEDHRLACGFGSALLEEASKTFTDGIKNPVVVLGAARKFTKHAPRDAQLMEIGVNADTIVRKAKQIAVIRSAENIRDIGAQKPGRQNSLSRSDAMTAD